jgi:hypothetical protein
MQDEDIEQITGLPFRDCDVLWDYAQKEEYLNNRNSWELETNRIGRHSYLTEP